MFMREAGDRLLERWESHRMAARGLAITLKRIVAGAGLDLASRTEQPPATVVALPTAVEPSVLPKVS